MREMTERLETTPSSRAAYAAAHDDYLAGRAELGDVPEIAGISAGGMPDRVKCLHVLVAHALGAGPGVNPLGDEALAMLDAWWESAPCSRPSQPRAGRDAATRRVGAIDCGTNSHPPARRRRRRRAGRRSPMSCAGTESSGSARASTVPASRSGSDGAHARACRGVRRASAASTALSDVRFVATSASRDARNADEFVAGVVEASGDLDVEPEVVTGDDEAALSFTGATGDLRRLGIEGPYLVVDIGGGSTELVRGTHDVEAGRSVDIGCVRMTERHLAGDPPTDDEVVAARADVAVALDAAEETVDLSGLGAVVGLAGSITTVTAHALGLGSYDRDAIHLAQVPLDGHREACRSLLGMSSVERGALPFMHPGRVDVIGAGALVWHEVLGRVALRSPGVRVVTSEHDILDGIALSVAAR